MNLLIFRHGIAEDATGDMTDAQRALTPEGIDQTRAAVRGLLRMIKGVDVILTSPLVRAAQTAELMGEVMGKPPQVMDELAGGSVSDLIDALSKRPEPMIAIVGHEPQLSMLAEHLLAGEETSSFLTLGKAGAALIGAVQCCDPGTSNLIWSLPSKALQLLATTAE